LLGAQGKTVFDPDFDIDDSGLPHEKPAIPAIECTQRVISRHNGPFRVMSALLLIERFQPGFAHSSAWVRHSLGSPGMAPILALQAGVLLLSAIRA
jgi:hypothetical protein